MKKFRQTCRSCAHYFWLFSAITVITIAIFVTLVKALLPQVEEYRVEFEQEIGQRLGLPVLIGAIEAQWKPLGPEIIIKELVINDPYDRFNVLSLRTAKIELNIWRSIINYSPYARLIELDGLVVNLEKKEEGGIALAGMKAQPSRAESVDYGALVSNAIDKVLAQSRIEIRDSRVLLADETSKSVSTVILQSFTVKNRWNAHQMIGKLSLAAAGTMDLVVEFNGDPRRDETVVQTYLKATELNLAKLPLVGTHTNNELESAFLNTEVWLERRNNHWQSAFAKVGLNTIEYKKEEEQHIPIDHLSMTVDMDRGSDGAWAINSNDLVVKADGISLSSTHWGLDVHPGIEGNPEISLNVRSLPIKKLTQLLAGSPYVDPQTYQRLGQLNLDGQIEHIRISFNREQSRQFEADVFFENVGSKPLNGIPGVRNVKGHVSYREQEGIRFNIENHDGHLVFDGLFRQIIPVGHLLIDGYFEQKDEGYSIDISTLSLRNPHLDMSGQVKLAKVKDRPLFMSLYAEVEHLDLDVLSNYLPVGVMGDALVQHLDNGIMGGTLQQVSVLSHGFLESFPYAASDGYFGVSGFTKKAQYQFLPDWPQLTGLDAAITFVRDELDIDVIQGRLLNVPLTEVRARIPTVKPRKARLELDVKISDVLSNLLEVINQSPLGSGLGQGLADINIEQKLGVAFHLKAGLTSFNRHFGIDGQVDFNGHRLRYKPLDIVAENFTGQVLFTDESVDSRRLRADIYGKPAVLHVKGDKNESGMLISIDINTAIQSKNIDHHIQGPWEHFISGDVPLDVNVNIQTHKEQAATVTTRIYSNLEQVEVRLPDTFYKAATTKKALSVTLRGKEYFTIEADYGDDLHAKILIKRGEDEAQLYGARIYFGAKRNRVHVPKGVNVTGKLATMDIEQWVSYFQSLSLEPKTQKGEPSLLNQVDVTIGQLKAKDFLFDDVAVMVDKPELDNFKLSLQNANLKGEVNILNKEAGPTIVINFERLIIPELPTFTESKGKASPEGLPPLFIECAYCEIAKKPIGAISLSGSPIPFGYEFDGAIKLSKLLNLNINGTWFVDQGFDLTTIKGTVQSEDIGALLNNWSLNWGVKSSNLEGKFNLHWPDVPPKASLAALGGTINLQLGQGYLEQVSDAPARIFSLLSLSSIRRRLNLNFNDLVKEGFFFDSIEGDFDIQNGWAKTTSTKVLGAAVDVEIKGASDLVKQEYDQQIFIKPKIGSSLPLLTPFAVEPMTALFVIALNEIFLTPALEGAVALEYLVTGSWDDPKVEQVLADEDKKGKRRKSYSKKAK